MILKLGIIELICLLIWSIIVRIEFIISCVLVRYASSIMVGQASIATLTQHHFILVKYRIESVQVLFLGITRLSSGVFVRLRIYLRDPISQSLVTWSFPPHVISLFRVGLFRLISIVLGRVARPSLFYELLLRLIPMISWQLSLHAWVRPSLCLIVKILCLRRYVS